MLAHTSVFLLAGTLLAAPAAAAPAGSAPPGDEPSAERPAEVVEQNPIELLLGEIDRLFEELTQVRRELAQVRLESLQSKRELDELRQFMRDRREYGQDFERYKEVRAAAEKEARQRQAEANRQRREVEKAERRAGRQAARSQRTQQRAEAQRVERYRKAGFSPLGLDVFAGKMAFYYESDDNVPYRFDYQAGFGHYLRFYPPHSYYPPRTQLDYSEMTISGSVLNAADEVRHLGIAIAFFDENGNQVGGETIQINNARPDVPYPFTATLDMALNRPFSSSSTYVLYADPADETDPVAIPPPAPTTNPSKPDYSTQAPGERADPARR